LDSLLDFHKLVAEKIETEKTDKKVPDVSIINITFYSEDKREAAQIANAIAQSYQDYRVRSRNEANAKGLEMFQYQYQQDEIQIKQATAELESLRQQYKITFDASAPKSPEEQPYWDKKHELDSLLDFHKLVAAKIETEKLDIKIRDVSMEEITSRAQPGLAPAGPNKPRNIVLGAVAGILLASVAGAISAFIAFQIRKRMRKTTPAT